MRQWFQVLVVLAFRLNAATISRSQRRAFYRTRLRLLESHYANLAIPIAKTVGKLFRRFPL
jgi:hypothetical protein